MKKFIVTVATLAFAAVVASTLASDAENSTASNPASVEAPKGKYFKPEESVSQGSVNVNGAHVDYTTVAGTLIVHPKDWDDVPPAPGTKADEKNPDAEASMFYVAYFKRGVAAESRPITFLFNGGPGSSTVWLHMGAFGPKRVVTANDSHTAAAPYNFINNDSSLLDASDLVFIDAPGTGFSRVAGKDKDKAFFGVDEDAHAFAEFITAFLTKHGRWNSPKYLFGESYGTTRNAALIHELEIGRSVDFNGVIMLSQILSFDMNGDSPQYNPAIDTVYQILLPTYAATAWYHHKLPGNPPDLHALLKEVQRYAMTDYGLALQAGSVLTTAQRKAVAEKLHKYTGLPVSYILKADLRINVGEFEKNLQGDTDTTTGRLDTRFSGPTMDPLSKEADYDPQSASISSAYVSAFNNYVRKDLHYGQDKVFKPEIDIWQTWNYLHQPSGAPIPLPQATNVIPDLSEAMKYNPNLKVMLNGGYYDLATPFYEGIYEMRHLQIPNKLQANIEYKYYESGHMVYANEASLKQLHDNVADFIRRTDNVN